jgi:plastocyanin
MRRLSVAVLVALCCTHLAPAAARPQTAATASYSIEVRDLAGAPVEHAVVALYPEGAPAPAPPLARKRPAPTGIMDQRNRQFIPHVLPVQRGTAVTFPNSDNMRHHVYSFSPAKRFELKLYSGLPPQPIVFEESGEVVLGCNIHDQMIGYIYVVDSPFFAATESRGLARVGALPAGRYQVEVWHPHGLGTPLRFEIDLAADEQRSDARQLQVRREGAQSGAAAPQARDE